MQGPVGSGGIKDEIVRARDAMQKGKLDHIGMEKPRRTPQDFARNSKVETNVERNEGSTRLARLSYRTNWQGWDRRSLLGIFVPDRLGLVHL